MVILTVEIKLCSQISPAWRGRYRNNLQCHIDPFIAIIHVFVFFILKTCSVTLKDIVYEVCSCTLTLLFHSEMSDFRKLSLFHHIRQILTISKSSKCFILAMTSMTVHF